MKRLWQRFRNWFQWTFGTPPAYDYYHVPVGYQNEPIGEANVGGINNRNYGACVATPYATDGLCLNLPPMSMEQAEYMFGREELAKQKENTNG